MTAGTLGSMANQVASYGRGSDTMLAHVSPDEAKFIDYLQGGTRTNPNTGLPEYGLLGDILKAAVRVGAGVVGLTLGGPAGAAIGSGLATKLTGGSWKDALKSGAFSGIGSEIAQGASGRGWDPLSTGTTDAEDTNSLAKAMGHVVEGAPESPPPSFLSRLGSNLTSTPGLAAGLGALSTLDSNKVYSSTNPTAPPTDNSHLPPPTPLPRQYNPYMGNYSRYGVGPNATEHNFFVPTGSGAPIDPMTGAPGFADGGPVTLGAQSGPSTDDLRQLALKGYMMAANGGAVRGYADGGAANPGFWSRIISGATGYDRDTGDLHVLGALAGGAGLVNPFLGLGLRGGQYLAGKLGWDPTIHVGSGSGTGTPVSNVPDLSSGPPTEFIPSTPDPQALASDGGGDNSGAPPLMPTVNVNAPRRSTPQNGNPQGWSPDPFNHASDAAYYGEQGADQLRDMGKGMQDFYDNFPAFLAANGLSGLGSAPTQSGPSQPQMPAPQSQPPAVATPTMSAPPPTAVTPTSIAANRFAAYPGNPYRYGIDSGEWKFMQPVHAARGGTIRGPGDGKSDSIPALLSDNEHVIDAGTVSLAGNGSSDAGHRVIDHIKQEIRRQAGQKNPRVPPNSVAHLVAGAKQKANLGSLSLAPSMNKVA